MMSVFDLENQDPFAHYDEIRKCPGGGQWDEGHQAWVLAAQSGCSFVQRSEDIFRHPYEDLEGSEEIKGARSLLLLKGEEHRRVHQYFSRYFTDNFKRIGRDVAQPIVDRLIDEMITRPVFDLGEAFADQLPVRVLAVVLGFEISNDEQLDKCRDINDRLTRWTETLASDKAVIADAKLAARELHDLIAPIAREKAEHPDDGLLSALHRDGPSLLDDWSLEVLVDQMKTLFPAGGHTTSNFLCSAMYLLLTDAELSRTLRDEPELTGAFVEEALRLVGPIHVRVREAAKDHALSGEITVRAGQRVHPLLAAAGRDPAVYDHPNEVDLTRASLRRHLAFSIGPRICVGKELAREVSRIALSTLLRRLPTLRLIEEADTKSIYRGLLTRGYRPLLATKE